MGSAVPSTMGTLMAKGLMQVGKELKGKAELPDVDMYIIFFLPIRREWHNWEKQKLGRKPSLMV